MTHRDKQPFQWARGGCFQPKADAGPPANSELVFWPRRQVGHQHFREPDDQVGFPL